LIDIVSLVSAKLLSVQPKFMSHKPLSVDLRKLTQQLSVKTGNHGVRWLLFNSHIYMLMAVVCAVACAQLLFVTVYLFLCLLLTVWLALVHSSKLIMFTTYL